MKLILKYLKPYWKYVALTILLIAAQSLSELFLPDINADIINNGVMQSNISYIWTKGALMLVIALVIGATGLGSSYFAAKVSMICGRDMRRDLFAKVQSFSQADVEKFGTPSLITRTTNDVNQVQQVIQMAVRMLLTVPIMCIGGIIMALKQDIALSVILVAVVPVIIVTMVIVLSKGHPLFDKMQKQVDTLNQVLREKLSGIRVIRAFVRTEYEEKRYDKANEDMKDISSRAHRVMTVMMPLTSLLMNYATLAAYWFGAGRINTGAMPIGNLTAFITYLSQILMSVSMASMMFNMLPRVAASMTRIGQVLTLEPSIEDKDVTDIDLGKFECVEFKDVLFAYPDAEQPVINHVNFTCRAGETTAIIGSTGSGKSTLINLIPRFFDVTGGQILINGHDIRDMSQKQLRDHLGYVAQKALLFDGTVASNLQYGKEDATEEEMWRALEVAQGKGFVEEKPGGLQSEISQGGVNVSGGQRQRLAIARAIVKKPDIYIFDDSFSALDFKTDARLRAALSEETKDAAVLIVAQRVSTILNAHQIIVMDEGNVAGIGTHKELMGSCQIYREIVLSQLSEEEVA